METCVQNYYNDLFQKKIDAFKQYDNESDRDKTGDILLSFADDIRILAKLPAYKNFRQLNLSQALTRLNSSAIWTQKKFANMWQPGIALVWPMAVSKCHGGEIVVHPLEHISTLREVQAALAPHNESVTYLEGQEPLIFPPSGTKFADLKFSSWEQSLTCDQVNTTIQEGKHSSVDSIKNQCAFIKMFREQEEYLKKNTEKKKEQEKENSAHQPLIKERWQAPSTAANETISQVPNQALEQTELEPAQAPADIVATPETQSETIMDQKKDIPSTTHISKDDTKELPPKIDQQSFTQTDKPFSIPFYRRPLFILTGVGICAFSVVVFLKYRTLFSRWI